MARLGHSAFSDERRRDLSRRLVAVTMSLLRKTLLWFPDGLHSRDSVRDSLVALQLASKKMRTLAVPGPAHLAISSGSSVGTSYLVAAKVRTTILNVAIFISDSKDFPIATLGSKIVFKRNTNNTSL